MLVSRKWNEVEKRLRSESRELYRGEIKENYGVSPKPEGDRRRLCSHDFQLWKDAWLYRWVAVISLLALLFGLPRPLALLERHLVNPEESFKDGWSAAGYV